VRTAAAPKALAATGLLAATLIGGAGHAAPRPTTLQEVVAWADAHLTGVDDWSVLGFNELGITFASPKGATLRGNGLIEGDLRQEFFEPIEVDGDVMRSTTARWTVDCAHQRYAVLSMTVFAGNNLKGQLSERETEPPNWLPRDKLSEQAIDALCETAKSGVRIDAPPSKK
jgi:hypothetical protein